MRTSELRKALDQAYLDADAPDSARWMSLRLRLERAELRLRQARLAAKIALQELAAPRR